MRLESVNTPIDHNIYTKGLLLSARIYVVHTLKPIERVIMIALSFTKGQLLKHYKLKSGEIVWYVHTI